jgi:hypothetical protein
VRKQIVGKFKLNPFTVVVAKHVWPYFQSRSPKPSFQTCFFQKVAIKMTTKQKHEYKATGYNNPWDPTTSISAYFMQLDRFQVSLGDRDIATSDAEKMTAAGAQM